MQNDKSLLLAGSAIALTLISTQAFAQSPEPASPASVEDVIVVGSRLRRDVYNSPSPVQTVTREEAVMQGHASTAEILQSTAVTGGTGQVGNSMAGYNVNGGAGVNTVGLRGMSPTRTLVLLNGRRVSPSGSRGSVGAADLNVLPSAMIERIEVLRDGASSVYGSDAVAGVINLQTRKNFEGLTLDARTSHPLDAGGAGSSHRLSVVGGLNGDRWRLAGAADYFERNEMALRDRDFTLCNRLLRRDPQTGVSLDTIDPLTGQAKCYPINGNGASVNLIATGLHTGVGAVGAIGNQFDRWRPNSAVTGSLAGWEGVGGGKTTSGDVRDSFDDRMLSRSLISPVKVANLYVEGGYRLNALGDAEAYFESLLNRRESYQTGTRQLVIDYAVGSPLIPANLAWSVAGPDLGLNKGKNIGVRAFTLDQNTAHQDVDFQRHILGLKGDFTPIAEWRYDAYVSFARSDSEYRQRQFLMSRLAESLDVVTGPNGSYQCRELAANPGCVAAPALSAALLASKQPADWMTYIAPLDVGTTEFEEFVAAAGFDGPVVDLPAGRVMAYAGLEYRRSSLLDTPSIASQTSDIYNYTSSTITKGSDSVWEAFGEVDVPLLADLPLVQNLNLTASYRYTDYESYGDDTTYKAGLFWRAADWLSLRASYGTSYRAPALFEQFVGATSGFINALNDPCNNFADKDENIRANCAYQGLPGGWQAKNSIKVVAKGGAETGLSAETSSNLTVGLVLRPFLPAGWGDLNLAIDYYEIEVKNGVSQLGGTNILTRCFASNHDDFKANLGVCRLIERDANSGALTVANSYVNLATDIVKGIDYNLRYTNDIGPGSLTFNLGVGHQPTQSRVLFAGDPLRNFSGEIGAPAYSGTADLSYGIGAWRARWGTEWVGAMDSYARWNQDPAKSPYILRTPDYFVHHLSAQYVANGWTATMGLRNLFNENPPEISATSWYNVIGNAPLMSSYDYAGRTAFINLSRTF